MASLVLGAVGGYFFGPIGFMIGSAIGNLLFPGKGQDGPRLRDLKLQGSSYGQMIPILWGRGRMAGQVIWQTDLVEHKHRQGGKGGPQVTTYTYTVSFAVLVCEGPINSFVKIWGDGTVLYDSTGTANVDNSKVPVKFYLGGETQTADPTMESVLGVGNVPGYRGVALAVFTDWDVGFAGNRIPNLQFEVIKSNAPVPWWEYKYQPFGWTNLAGPNNVGPHTGALENGQLVISQWTGLSFQLSRFDITNGNLISADAAVTAQPVPGQFSQVTIYCQNNPHISHAQGAPDTCGFYYDGVLTVAIAGTYTFIGPPGGSFVYNPVNDCVYGVGSTGTGATLTRYQCTNGAVYAGSPSASYNLATGTGTNTAPAWNVAVDELGNIWAGFDRAHGSNPVTDTWCFKFDKDLNLLDSWLGSEVAGGSDGFNGLNFTVWGGMVAFNRYLSLSQSCSVYLPTHPWTLVGSCQTGDPGNTPLNSAGNMISLANGLILCSGGIANLTPSGGMLLSDVVADISLRAGLNSGQIDVTQLTYDTVQGYMLAQQSECRTALLPLQSAYWFDGTESGSIAKFIKRGAASIITITDDELAAQPTPVKPDEPYLHIKRTREVALPDFVYVKYLNLGADLQDGVQRANRESSLSQVVSNVELAIVMTDGHARQIAYVLLYEAWTGRQVYTAHVARKYLWLEPTDVFSARGYTFRILRKRDVSNGTIELECVETNGSVYSASPTPVATLGYEPSVPGFITQNTQLKLLDIPLVTDNDINQSFYAAMAGASNNSWPGADLYKSLDNGANYTDINTSNTADTIGLASTALADFTNGNVFDEGNTVDVTIGRGGGTLSSTSELAVLNGANMALLGTEIIQYKNAVLTTGTTYRLSGLLRGRRGTEWRTPTHVAGEIFVVLPVSINQSINTGELAATELYKAVSTGQALSAPAAQSFICNGATVTPYAPVQLGGGLANVSGDVAMTWLRRTRIGGAWSALTDVPLSEASEIYIVQIWDSTYKICARVITVNAAQTVTYTAAQQNTDFGANQQTVFFTVGQLGSYVLGTQAKGTAAGNGGGINTPLNPVPPYNSAPPPPGGTCALPTTTSSFTWSAPVSQFNTTMDQTKTWVISFTTPITPVVGACRIDAAEYGGVATQRDMVLALSPCGAPINNGAHQVGNTVSIIFYMSGNPFPAMYPTLAPNTTYYISINSLGPSGMICNLFHP
jgi:hypothetical protein